MTIDYRDAKLLWPAIYKAVHEILGDAHVILPLGDELIAGKVNATTFEAKAMGATAPADLTWTPNEALSAWDTPFDLTEPGSWRGAIPILTFNGTDEEADTPDDGFYSRGDGANDSVFSVGAWVWLNDTSTERSILAKANEWRWFVRSADDRLSMLLRDESTGDNVERRSQALPLVQWVFVVSTYDGAGGAAATNNAKAYVNGVDDSRSPSHKSNFPSRPTQLMKVETTDVESSTHSDVFGSLPDQMQRIPLHVVDRKRDQWTYETGS